MNHKLLRVLALLCFALSLPFLLSAETQYLTILHTNDTHSTLFPYGPHNDWGGIARMSTLIKEIKAETPNVLVVNAGDVFVGSFEFNKYLGYAELKIMEDLYDAMALGNHEFDLGVQGLLGVLSGALAGGEPVDGFPILCSNVNLAGVPALQQLVKPYCVVPVGDIKVGLIGVVNYDALNYSPEVYGLLSDPFQAAGQAAFMLKYVEGADIVICLSHLGHMYDVMGLSQVPLIDVIVGGHTNDAITGPTVVNGKIIAAAGEFGRYLGQVVVEIDGSQVQLISQRLQPVNWPIRQDPALRPTLNMLREGIVMDPRFGPVYTQHIATAPWDLEERWDLSRPERDTPLGNLVADGIKQAVISAGYPADIALEANGYTAYKIHKGKVVGNEIMKAVPYGYDEASGLGFKIDTVLLAGAQILAGLEYSVSMVEYTDDASMQVSGLSFKYDSSKTSLPGEQIIYNLTHGIMEWGRVDPFSIKVNGYPLELGAVYWVALTEQLHRFLLANGLEPFASIPTGILEYNAVRDFMAAQQVLNYTIEGRVIDLAGGPVSHALSPRNLAPLRKKGGAPAAVHREPNHQ